MAITSTVVIDKPQSDSGGFASSGQQQDELSQSLNVTYAVDYKDDADPKFDGGNLDAPYVLANKGLPLVNGSAWYDPFTDKLYPYLICRNKTARRHPSKKSRWLVSTMWSTGRENNATTEGGLAGVAPPADASEITDLEPTFEWSLGQQEVQVYNDIDGNALLLPTGSQFKEPFYKTIATIKVVVRHYQNSINYEQLRDRRFAMNEDAYAGKAADSWMIQNCSATEVDVYLATGETAKAALVVHELEWTILPQGWKDRRALVDTHYLDPSTNDAIAFQDGEFQTQWIGNIDSAGYPLDQPVPAFKDFAIQSRINFIPLIPQPTFPTFQTWGEPL